MGHMESREQITRRSIMGNEGDMISLHGGMQSLEGVEHGCILIKAPTQREKEAFNELLRNGIVERQPDGRFLVRRVDVSTGGLIDVGWMNLKTGRIIDEQGKNSAAHTVTPTYTASGHLIEGSVYVYIMREQSGWSDPTGATEKALDLRRER